MADKSAPITLDLSGIRAEPAPLPGPKAEKEQRFFAREEQEVELDLLRLLKFHRKYFAPAVFLVMLAWMFFVAVVVWRTADESNSFKLSDSVLTALVAGASVNVIGLFGTVMWSVFPRGNQP